MKVSKLICLLDATAEKFFEVVKKFTENWLLLFSLAAHKQCLS